MANRKLDQQIEAQILVIIAYFSWGGGDKKINGWINELDLLLDRWMNGWMDEWTDEQTESMDGWMNG